MPKQLMMTIRDPFEMTEREKKVFKDRMIRHIRKYKLVKTGRPISKKRAIAIVNMMMQSIEETKKEFT